MLPNPCSLVFSCCVFLVVLQPLLIENIEEELDPVLDPVLEKRLVKKGKSWVLQLADKEVGLAGVKHIAAQQISVRKLH